jgi:hypothetical protein
MSSSLSKKLKPIHPIPGFIIVNKMGFPIFHNNFLFFHMWKKSHLAIQGFFQLQESKIVIPNFSNYCKTCLDNGECFN